MPSLPSTIDLTIDAEDDLVCSKANQDNFGVTYRGSYENSSNKYVAMIKVKHSDEGSKTSPTERHILDATITVYPQDGSPSYVAQLYVHAIKGRGRSNDLTDTLRTGIAQVLNPTTSLGIGYMDWSI